MPCEVLIKAWNMPNGTRKGSFSVIRDQPWNWGHMEALPDYVQLVITDASRAQVSEYTRGWMTEYDYEVINHNVALDGYRIRLWSKYPNVSGQNVITKTQVENYLEGWNGIFQSASANEVVFDFGIYQCAISANFWGEWVLNVGFTEVSYDQGTGVHVIDADYSALAQAEPSRVEGVVLGVGAEIISHDLENKIIRFSVDRSLVTSKLKADIHDVLSKRFEMRRYLIMESTVDAMIAQGGRVEKTKAEVLTYMRDRLTE